MCLSDGMAVGLIQRPTRQRGCIRFQCCFFSYSYTLECVLFGWWISRFVVGFLREICSVSWEGVYSLGLLRENVGRHLLVCLYGGFVYIFL